MMIRNLRFAVLVFLSIGLLVACSSGSPAELQKKDLVPGTGEVAVKGATLTVHYTGWLYVKGQRDKKFDSSVGKEPFTFKLGAGEVIAGWDRGFEGMKVGGKRELIIPPQLGYGTQGAPPDIPPNAVLDFEVQLLKVRK
jgi:FKBP-type peptidyl-prolyl cis-trans isomerase FkpA